MAEPRDSGEAYQQARQSGVGTSDPRFRNEVGMGIAAYQRDQEQRRKEAEEFRKVAQESVTKHYSPEYQRAYRLFGEAIGKILWPFLVWSAFGMGVYFGMHALAKVFGMGETKAVFPFYTSINGFFAIGVFVPMVFGLYKLYKKSSKRFWQVNLSLVAVSFAILLI